MFRKYRIPLFVALALSLPVLAGCNMSGAQDESLGTVTIGVGPPFPTSEVPAEIAKVILEDRGYDVELISGDVGFTYAGVAKSDIDLYLDAWLPNQNPYMERYGDIEKLAVSYGDTQTGFFVPAYEEDINTVADLVGKEDRFDGTVYTPGEGYGTTISTRLYLENHPELKLEVLPSSEAAMVTTVSDMTRRGEHVVFTFYRPQPLFERYDYKFLSGGEEEFGLNSVWVIAAPDLREAFPEVYDAFKNWSFDVDTMQEMMAQIDEGTPASELAEQWVEAHKDEVQSWWD